MKSIDDQDRVRRIVKGLRVRHLYPEPIVVQVKVKNVFTEPICGVVVVTERSVKS